MLNRTRKLTEFALTPHQKGEHELQIDCTAMLKRLLLPEVAWTAIDHGHSFDQTIGRNGRPIGLMEAQKRKARGIEPGIFDYAFWHGGASFALELKVGLNDLSDDQETWGKRLIRAGVECKVCWSIDQVCQTVIAWRLTRPMRVMA